MKIPAAPVELEVSRSGDGGKFLITKNKTISRFVTRVVGLEPGRVKLSIRNRDIWARTNQFYEIGDILKGTVSKKRDGSIILHIEQREQAYSLALRFLQENGLPKNSRLLEIVTTLLRSGRPLDAKLVRRLIRVPERRRRSALEWFDRGFPEDNFEQEGISIWQHGFTGTRERRRRERNSDEKDGTKGDGSVVSADSTRDYLTRTAEIPDSPLQLFNHISGTSDLHWIVIPVRMNRGENSVEGVIRAGVSRSDGKARSIHLDVIARDIHLEMKVDTRVDTVSWIVDGVEGRRRKEMEAELAVIFNSYDTRIDSEQENSEFFGVDIYG